ncbi:hypothetical protein LTR62_003126 [Meristemomyces frigidus]|uniref:Uncharacterized protein n=1 Tax=Meristemomyces frigidus TaxID=1508187 RepID=A0AAN7TK29_9PEZI|nr:hypothetical protein LTR62_003126 [Meristemomyces frigidus]
MPTFHAVGLTATLSVADLQTSCSNIVDKRMGKQQQADADRIYNVFSSGHKLQERPIGADGSTKGVAQYIGSKEDLPFFLVEAGEGVQSGAVLDPQLVNVDKQPASNRKGSDNSSLTPFGVTPSEVNAGVSVSGSQESALVSTPSVRKKRSRKNKGDTATVENDPLTFASFDRARGFLDSLNKPQALCLTIEICDKSFLPTAETGRASGQDLKVEVFLNGELVGISFVNTRGAAVELKNDRLRYTGTRVHRQVEKPWVYDTRSAVGYKPAAVRWDDISRKLQYEAESRGLNKWGDSSPSAEFLLALSQTSLPAHLHDRHGLAIMDVVVTAGRGRKYGPDTSYMTIPRRLDDPSYEPKVAMHESGGDLLFGLSQRSDSPFTFCSAAQPPRVLLQSSPEIPLMRQRSAVNDPQTPSPHRKHGSMMGFNDLKLDGVNLNMKVSPFENARRKPGQRQRNLRQRLKDIQQMNPTNQAKAIEGLREELNADQIHAVKKEIAKQNKKNEQRSPSKKARLDHVELDPDHEYGLNMLAGAGLAPPDTMNPMSLWPSSKSHLAYPSNDPFGSNDHDTEAKLAQSRLDLAVDFGAEFNGPLTRHLATVSSANSSPEKITRASSLANSPCKVPVKVSLRSKAQKLTPQRQSMYVPRFGTPIPLDPVLSPSPDKSASKDDGSPTKKSGRGANRTRHVWDPTEVTAEKAFEEFVIPELCRGSVVSYPEDGKFQRQVGKARGGEFVESTVVVGMRFVVT